MYQLVIIGVEGQATHSLAINIHDSNRECSVGNKFFTTLGYVSMEVVADYSDAYLTHKFLSTSPSL